MTLEILRRFLLVALAVLAFQGGSAREAFAKRAEYDAALERAYEWSKQTHAAEERVMGGLALEARDLLRHPPEVATPPAPGRPDAAAVARSSPEPHRPKLARADVETPQPAPFEPGLGSRLWAWLAEIRIRDQESDANGETEAEQPTPSRAARLWAWLSQPPQELEPGGDIDLEAEGETGWPGASLWARLAALFGGADAPRATGHTQVAVVEARREPVAGVSSSAEVTPERSVSDELGERTAARDPGAERATTKIRTKTVRAARPAAPTPIAQARADPPEPPPWPATAAKRVAAAQPAEASAPRQAAPPPSELRPMASESGTPGPSPPRAEPARIAERSVPDRTAPARHVEVGATPPPTHATRVRAASEAKHRPGLAARTERAEEPTEPLPRRSRPTGAPTFAGRAAPRPAPTSNSRATAAEAPPRVSSHRAARGERVARAEPHPREEPPATKPRSAVRRPPRPELQEAFPEPAEPWRTRGRALARQELARVQAALQRDGRSTREIDPLRVAIDILRAEQQQALAAADRR